MLPVFFLILRKKFLTRAQAFGIYTLTKKFYMDHLNMKLKIN